MTPSSFEYHTTNYNNNNYTIIIPRCYNVRKVNNNIVVVYQSRSVELTAQLMGFSTESVRKTILTALEKLKHSNYSERLQEGVSLVYAS